MLVTSGIGSDVSRFDWQQKGMTIFSQTRPLEKATSHGQLKLGESTIHPGIYPVQKYSYRSNQTQLINQGYVLNLKKDKDKDKEKEVKSSTNTNTNSMVAMACGLMRMDYSAASIFFGLHVIAPFSSCTSFGVDDGMTVTPFSLFLHVLPAVLNDAEYVTSNPQEKKMQELLRTQLGGRFSLNTVLSSTLFNSSAITYVHSVRDAIKYTLFEQKQQQQQQQQQEQKQQQQQSGTVVLNSTLGGTGEIEPCSVLLNCALNGDGWKVGTNSVVVGLSLSDQHEAMTVPENCVVQEIYLTDTTTSPQDISFNYNENGDNVPSSDCTQASVVVLVYGMNDSWHLNYTNPNATFCGQNWSTFFQRTGLTINDIWPNQQTQKDATEACTLATAKLYCPMPANGNKNDAFWFLSNESNVIKKGKENFDTTPVQNRLSLLEISQRASLRLEFHKMHDLQFQIDSVLVRDVLLNRKHVALLDIYARCALRKEERIFLLLDDIAQNAPMDVQARTFAHIADVLAAFAGKGRGLRSGPARNPQWQHALEKLITDTTRSEGVTLMSRVRENWRARGKDMMIRASRHYEGGGQRLILAATSTCGQFISHASLPWEHGLKAWAVATAPARLDLSGGWSDTPPLCFEHGGAVTNIGIKINGK